MSTRRLVPEFWRWRSLSGGLRLLVSCCVTLSVAPLQAAEPLPGTDALTWDGDLSARMVAGLDTMLMRELAASLTNRAALWKRDFSSREAYDKSVQPNRDHLRRQVGAIDPRVAPTALTFVGSTAHPSEVSHAAGYTVHAVRWTVFAGMHAEGLWLRPSAPAVARVVVLPDADQTPELLCGLAPGLAPENQLARRLAENGCEVLVPVLINRQDTWSGNAGLDRFTNLPHREWIYRPAFELGRHIIGYEVQKTLAAVDWFALEDAGSTGTKPPIGVAGYGEGGLIALYSAALDTRIQAVLVSGYYDSRQRVWEEPIYRNVFGLLREFGDAEIASLVAPRGLVVEYSPTPRVEGPPAARAGRQGAAPGRLVMPERFAVESEVERARALFPTNFPFQLDFVYGNEGAAVGPFCNQALVGFLRAMGLSQAPAAAAAEGLADARAGFDPGQRQKAQIEELVAHNQRLLALAEREREAFLWSKLEGAYTNDWATATRSYRDALWDNVIGRLPKPSGPLAPRSRSALDKPKWLGYEVVLDVSPDVFAWGYLLIPRDLRPGERRPVVVCQHGLEGVPLETINAVTEPGFEVYRGFAARLAERGFVVFAPHNPYRGGDAFRVLQRKANPLKLSLFSVITAQHERILDWLAAQPFVDPQRIAFYGLSYGGKTAMRVPALLDRYALSICSADFNDWVRKVATVDSLYSYQFTGEYELPEFDLGNTFNYAEMAALIAPRPFMVERGHFDGVAPDEWVAYEYARVRRMFVRLGYPERTAIEFFEGPHAINGVGTFQFLYRHLNWQGR